MRYSTSILLAASSFLALAAPALAQLPAATPTGGQTPQVDGSQDIVVTAQKRTERLQDVPMSVTAVSAPDLVKQNLLSIRDYASRIPSVTVNAATNRTNGIAIRGITTGGGGNPTVAILIDDIPFGGSGYAALTQIPDLDPSDLAQIEVLRGPQGVLYGASNLGGLIKYVTKTADPNNFSGRIEVGGSTVAHGDQGYQARGAVNIPIVSDAVGLRVSGYYRRDPGFIDNTLTGRSDVNSSRTYGGRASLFLAPTDRLKVNFAALYQKLDANELGFAELGPDYRPATPALGAGFTGQSLAHATGTTFSTTTQRLYSARADYDLDFATLTALTGYNQARYSDDSDTTARFADLLGLFGFPNGTRSALTNQSRTNKLTQEVRLASPTADKVEWLIGGFYTHEKSQLNQQVTAFPGGTATSLYSVLGPNTYEEIAGFANLTYKFSSQFDVQVGGRYAHNRQHVIQDADGPLNGGPSLDDDRSSESAFTWLVTPRYHFGDGTMLYARVATGYRPGGPNSTIPGLPADFKSDRTTNYEIGLKGNLFDRKLTYDLSAYWIDWKRIQLFLTAPNGFSYFDNGKKARSRGLEGSVTWKPATDTAISGNFSWNGAELRNAIPSAAAYARAGDRLPFTPKFSGNLAVDQTFGSGSIKPSAGATLTYVGDRKAAFSVSQAIPRMDLAGYVAVDLRAGLDISGGWSANLYLRNLFDRKGITTGQLRTAANAASGFQAYLIQPRTVGINLAKTF